MQRKASLLPIDNDLRTGLSVWRVPEGLGCTTGASYTLFKPLRIHQSHLREKYYNCNDQQPYSWYIVHGTCNMVHGAQYMVHGTWYTAHGTQHMVHGTWYTVHGTWYMVHGTWYMVHRALYMVNSTSVLVLQSQDNKHPSVDPDVKTDPVLT
jgi:hypothetical protein